MSNSPPLVVHIIYALGTGGLENGLVNIINRAPKYRHAIICLTTADEFASRITAEGVEVIELHKKPGLDLGVFVRLFRVLKRLKPSIVHTRNLASLEMQVVTLLFPRMKRVHGEHGRDVHDLDGSNKKYNFMRRCFQPFIHRYIAVSQDLSEWLKHTVGLPERKVTQIYNGVDANRFSRTHTSSIQPEGFPDNFRRSDLLIVGTVGRLAEVKNQQFLVAAFAALLKQYPEHANNLRLLLVGDGPSRTKIEDQIAELGIADYVWLAGDRTDIPALLQVMDIFVLPSLGEGISNTILEAKATGIPVVATQVGGNPELIQDGNNGRLVPVNDVKALSAVLKEMIDNEPLRNAMAERGQLDVKNTFNWDRAVAEYMAVYDEVLGVKPT